jgi:hypothetical protein
MTYLSNADLLAAAPATAPRADAAENKLLDTAEWLADEYRDHGRRPVFAIQGSSHGDAKRARAEDGRHLVVAVAPGIRPASFLLNSHTKDRRSRVAVGFWDGESFLIAASLPVQRWKGYSEQMRRMGTSLYRADTAVLYARLSDWRPQSATVKEFLDRVLPRIYRKGQNRPSTAFLLGVLGGSMMDVCHGLMARIMAGNMPSAKRGRRNVKGMQRPDALLHAAETILTQACAFGQAKGTVPAKISLTVP